MIAKLVLIGSLVFSSIFSKTDIFFSHDYSDDGHSIRCGNLSAKLIELIGLAKTRIYIAIYMITDDKVADALIAAKKKRPNLDIKLVVDETSIEFVNGKALKLAKGGVGVWVYDFTRLRCDKKGVPNNKERKVVRVCRGFPTSKSALMHNKYALFDDDKVWTGSFNFTCRANFHNQENALITTDREVARKTAANFQCLLRHSNFMTPQMVEEAVREDESEITRGLVLEKDDRKGRKLKGRKKKKLVQDWEFFFNFDQEGGLLSSARRWMDRLGGVVAGFFV